MTRHTNSHNRPTRRATQRLLHPSAYSHQVAPGVRAYRSNKAEFQRSERLAKTLTQAATVVSGLFLLVALIIVLMAF
jgi:hypothetical protein